MSDSALRMVLGDLKGLLKDGTITFPQYQAAYQAELAAIRKEAREAESSSSPQREVEHSLGGVKTQQEVPVKDVSHSEEIGGAVFGSGAAFGYPWSVVEDSVEGFSL